MSEILSNEQKTKEFLSANILGKLNNSCYENILHQIIFDEGTKVDWAKASEIINEQMPELNSYRRRLMDVLSTMDINSPIKTYYTKSNKYDKYSSLEVYCTFNGEDKPEEILSLFSKTNRDNIDGFQLVYTKSSQNDATSFFSLVVVDTKGDFGEAQNINSYLDNDTKDRLSKECGNFISQLMNKYGFENVLTPDFTYKSNGFQTSVWDAKTHNLYDYVENNAKFNEIELEEEPER